LGRRVANAVRLLHGTSATSKQFFSPTMGGELFGPGQPLDAASYYVIVPDGLGRGGSTKPSDGLHAKFPCYGYADVVNAQHLLVTKGTECRAPARRHRHAIGGMHAWMWAERIRSVNPVADDGARRGYSLAAWHERHERCGSSGSSAGET